MVIMEDTKILRVRFFEAAMFVYVGYLIGSYREKKSALDEAYAKRPPEFNYDCTKEPIARKVNDDIPLEPGTFKVNFEEGGMKVKVNAKETLKDIFRR